MKKNLLSLALAAFALLFSLGTSVQLATLAGPEKEINLTQDAGSGDHVPPG